MIQDFYKVNILLLDKTRQINVLKLFSILLINRIKDWVLKKVNTKIIKWFILINFF